VPGHYWNASGKSRAGAGEIYPRRQRPPSAAQYVEAWVRQRPEHNLRTAQGECSAIGLGRLSLEPIGPAHLAPGRSSMEGLDVTISTYDPI